MQRLSDEQLLAAVLAGEHDALTVLVERYQAPLTGYIDRLVGADWSLAQDLVQETFLRVLQQHSSRGIRPFRPWIYAIATNLVRDHFKSGAVRFVARLAPQHKEQLTDEAMSPEEWALASERRTAIVAALSRVSLEYRVTLWLRFYSGLSLQEIAATLDIPLGTVKSRLSVGLRRLRETVLTPEGIHERGDI